jgi:hypothetical protein
MNLFAIGVQAGPQGCWFLMRPAQRSIRSSYLEKNDYIITILTHNCITLLCKVETL